MMINSIIYLYRRGVNVNKSEDMTQKASLCCSGYTRKTRRRHPQAWSYGRLRHRSAFSCIHHKGPE